jgi:hypothetical protein
MSEHEQGWVFDPERYTIKDHDELRFQRFMVKNFGDVPDWRRDLIGNRFRLACEAWFIRGGGDKSEFDRLFDNEKGKV